MAFTETCRKSSKTLFPSSIAIDASYCGFFKDVKCVLSLLEECNCMTAAIAILLIVPHSTMPLCYHYSVAMSSDPFSTQHNKMADQGLAMPGFMVRVRYSLEIVIRVGVRVRIRVRNYIK